MNSLLGHESATNLSRKTWREYCASIFRKGLGPFPLRGVRRDKLLSDESDWEDPYDVAGRQYVDDYNFDVPDGMDLIVFERGGGPSRSEMTVDETRAQVDNNPDDPDLVDIRRDVRDLPDAFPAIFDKTAAAPMTLPVDVETGPKVDDDPDDPDLVDIRCDVRNLPDAFPAIFNKMADVPMTLPVDVETGPQVDNDPDDPDLVDIRHDVRNLPDAFPAIFDKTAAVPMSLPVVVETGPQVWCESDLLLSERDMEVDGTDVNRDILLLTDVCPMRFEESATVPLSWPVVVDTETQVDVRWETTSVVVPFGDGCGRPAGWLDPKSDCCVMYEIVLDLEMSPIVSVRSAAVPAFLPTKSEVCSLAVLAGGPCCGSPPGSG